MISKHRQPVKPSIAVKAFNLLHLLGGEIKVKDVGILLNPGRRHRLRDDHDPPLNQPPEDYLGWSLRVLAGDGLDLGVVQQVGLPRFGPGPVRRP